MSTEPADRQALETRIRLQASTEAVRLTQHAQQEMTEEGILLDEVLSALTSAHVLEDYPEHRRGPCCLVYGKTPGGRNLHVVCTADRPVLIIITVYEPMPPKWVTPTERSR